MLRALLTWLAEHKLVTLLSVVMFSFVVATIVVAVEKANMQDDLDICYKELTEATRTTEATTEATSEATTTTGTEGPQIEDPVLNISIKFTLLVISNKLENMSPSSFFEEHIRPF